MSTPAEYIESDLESRANEGHHEALRLWLRMLSCTNRIESVIRKRLAAEFATTLPRFDLMAQLERHRDGLTMRELSQRMMVTGGNVTGITDQLENEGLVVRTPHPSDRRALFVRLTPAGRRLFRRMASIHERWVVELFDGWSEEEKEHVHKALASLKTHLANLDTSPATRRLQKVT
jgi:DNA-binding MarR family transcriptional regulator